jgi:DUF971 family protein
MIDTNNADSNTASIDDSSFAAAQVTPVDLNLNLKDQKLTIAWQDGRRSEFQLGRLRRVCPCATCRKDRDKPSTSLTILKMPAGVDKIEVIDAELVGRYAINLKWSDGHNSGIYDYKYLRALDAEPK